ncbi:MAG TPA: transcription elongation factor GreB [Alphaproteobacteria bacterium]|nr:transcription elongation factor GreB [Rhodospirillaceae bacterium]HRJ11939.1 transcription elongation factor GreB [Alphaproteobacteria bacterium]
MSKAFTKETDNTADDGGDDDADTLPAGQKNYMTPAGLAALRAEHQKLFYEERPEVVQVVTWAAGNGDRSENGDYIYGKKRLREIDRRVRYLRKRIESAVVVDPAQQKHLDQVFFGAIVAYARGSGEVQTVQIVGLDEADLGNGKINFLSPIARAMMKSRVGDEVTVRAPAGNEVIEIISITYPA